MSVTQVNAKFVCSSKTEYPAGGSRSDPTANIVIALNVVTTGEDNRSWSKWTPQGEIKMTITNPTAADFFKPGKEYLLSFVEPEPALSDRQREIIKTIGHK